MVIERIERIESVGFFGRLKAALGGVVVGLLLIVVAVGVQFWNEGRTLKRQNLLDAGRAAVVSADAARVDAAFDGKLVHVRGDAQADEVLTDPVFEQEAEGIALRRTVEMYQWDEDVETREETVNGEKRRRKIYSYDKEWSKKAIDHTRFEQPQGHENPGELPFDSERWSAERVHVGSFALAPAVIEEITGWKPMAADIDRLPENLAASFRADDEYLTTSASSASPQIGDVRVSFERIPGGDVTIVAKQAGSTLDAWTYGEDTLVLFDRGLQPAATLFDAADNENAGIAWAVRIGGFVVLWIGFGLLFGPITTAFELLPFAGGAARWLIGLGSGVLAAFVSFVAIASGWLFNRPLLLLVVVAVFGFGLYWLIRRFTASKAAAAPPMPPPPSAMPPPPPPV